MNSMRSKVALAAIAGATVAGGAVGVTAFAANTSGTATTSTGSSSTPAAAPSSGTFRPIETQAHEAAESAQREAQEDAGQVPTVP